MTVRTDVVMGVDVGTTSAKVLVRDSNGGREVLISERTPWMTAAGGTETTAARLLDLVWGLLTRAAHETTARLGPVQVVGVGVAGLAESGILLDSRGAPCAPVIAWFDRRGKEQVAALDSHAPLLRQQFPRRTGLPWDCQPSLAKLLWLRDSGTAIPAAHRWASVPEWLAHQLGADLVREPSLASRTGLVDQRTGEVWAEGAPGRGARPRRSG